MGDANVILAEQAFLAFEGFARFPDFGLGLGFDDWILGFGSGGDGTAAL